MGQPSTIVRLPADILEKLQELLRDPRVTQLDATSRINEILAAEGHTEKVTKSAVNRYSLQMRQVGEKLQHSREIAQMWIGKLGAAPQGQVGNLINGILQTLAFDVSLKLQDGELDAESMPDVINQLKSLSLAAMRLEKAASENVLREKEIRKQEREKALQDAAKMVTATAKQQGLNAEQAKFWREQILGVR